MSVRPSVWPLISAPLPLDGLPWNLILATFTKICPETPNLFEIGRKYRELYVKTQGHLKLHCLATLMMIIMIIGSIYGGRRGAFRVSVRIPKWKRSLKRPRCRWENNIKLGLQEIGWEGRTGWGQAAGCCECGNEPSGSIKCGEFLDTWEGICSMEFVI
jgi:hypothetical protein